MLIEFTVGNYRSFAEPVTLSMEATKLKARDSEVDAKNTFPAGKNLELVKVAAIYGANASGKSNLLRALEFMVHFVSHSHEGTARLGNTGAEPNLLRSDLRNKPSHFEIVFLMHDGVKVRYGFEVSPERVEREWLYTYPSPRPRTLLDRVGDAFRIGGHFSEAREVEKFVKANALLLSVSANLNQATAGGIVDRITDITCIDVASPDNLGAWARLYGFARDKWSTTGSAIGLVMSLDLGLAGIKVELRPDVQLVENVSDPVGSIIDTAIARSESISDLLKVKTSHKVFDEQQQNVGEAEFDLDQHESVGTRRAFEIARSIVISALIGGALTVDEIDSSLHPLLVRQIVEYFQSSTTNPNNTQLIFSTHDSSLLDADLFRRDQIWFVEKSAHGASSLYSLADFDTSRVRNDSNYLRDYLSGRYGAIPYLGPLPEFEEVSE